MSLLQSRVQRLHRAFAALPSVSPTSDAVRNWRTYSSMTEQQCHKWRRHRSRPIWEGSRSFSRHRDRGKRCPYEVLAVDAQATHADIKKAYRLLALKWHPDTCQHSDAKSAKLKFDEATHAYTVLSGPSRPDKRGSGAGGGRRRSAYDQNKRGRPNTHHYRNRQQHPYDDKRGERWYNDFKARKADILGHYEKAWKRAREYDALQEQEARRREEEFGHVVLSCDFLDWGSGYTAQRTVTQRLQGGKRINTVELKLKTPEGAIELEQKEHWRVGGAPRRHTLINTLQPRSKLARLVYDERHRLDQETRAAAIREFGGMEVLRAEVKKAAWRVKEYWGFVERDSHMR